MLLFNYLILNLSYLLLLLMYKTNLNYLTFKIFKIIGLLKNQSYYQKLYFS